MRVHEKKKLYAAHVRAQVLNSYINRPDGGWMLKQGAGNTECSDHKFTCGIMGMRGKASKSPKK